MVQQATQAARDTAAGVAPRAAIHDAVARIVGRREFHRSLRESVLGGWWRRFIAWLDHLGRSMGALPHGRAIAVAAAIAIVALVIFRIAYASRLRDERSARVRRPRDGSDRGDDVWREAAQLAAEGRYTEAAHELYRATVAELAARGDVRPHQSKTSGDYARELRRRGSPSHAAFRAFGRAYERMIYGSAIVSEAGYAELRTAVAPIFAPPGAARAA